MISQRRATIHFFQLSTIYPDSNFHPFARFLRLLQMVPSSPKRAKPPITAAKIMPADATCQSSQNPSTSLTLDQPYGNKTICVMHHILLLLPSLQSWSAIGKGRQSPE